MIQINHLNKTYDRHGRNANHVLKDISIDLPETGFVCILGPSGCGKTSLLNALGGLDRFDNGTITTASGSFSRYGTKKYEDQRNRDFGYIFQNYYLLPEHSVAYNIYLGLHSLKLSHREKLKRIRNALAAVDMGRYIRRKVGELSGGQQQRVAIARALARQPRVIFADEPTGNLDEANTMNICTLLRKISKNSLVIMVTHEERIANFFADRIIKLDNGRISEDASLSQRQDLLLGNDKQLYAGDYADRQTETEGVSLRLLQQEGAAPVALTVVALKDRIVIKLADSRAVTCSDLGEVPLIKEGPRPVLSLEVLDQEASFTPLTEEAPPVQTRAGHGIHLGMIFREAQALVRGRGARRFGMRIFLALLTALSVWTACDYLTVSSVNPRDFITTHSHILELRMHRGNSVPPTQVTMQSYYAEYREALKASGLDVDFIPAVSSPASYSSSVFIQTNSAKVYLKGFSYVPLRRLSSDALIMGSMPQNSRELVVDIWTLEKLLEEDSIIKNSLSNVEYFLGQEIFFEKLGIRLTISGICDSGEPAIYVSDSQLLQLGGGSSTLTSLSDFQASNPDSYHDWTLSGNECIYILYKVASAGGVSPDPADYIGKSIKGYDGNDYLIKYVLTEDDLGYDRNIWLVVSDKHYSTLLENQLNTHYFLYCADKAAVKQYLEGTLAEDFQGSLIVDVTDDYSTNTAEYLEVSRLKVDARLIVTFTVMGLSLVMLYLLCRSQAQERIGMMAVYRLLGIPRRKLASIFAIESMLASVQTSLPVAALVHCVITILNSIEDLELSMVLPWQATLAVFTGTALYYILVALLPLLRLLHMPPAQLAGKYDY